jgi:ribosomal protein L24E
MSVFGLKKRCEYCREEIEKGKGISEHVEVYGRTDKPEKHFCCEEHLQLYKQRTRELMKTRRPRICMRCLR